MRALNKFVADFYSSQVPMEEYIKVNSEQLMILGLDEEDVKFFLQIVSHPYFKFFGSFPNKEETRL
jgi:hypothetical protein